MTHSDPIEEPYTLDDVEPEETCGYCKKTLESCECAPVCRDCKEQTTEEGSNFCEDCNSEHLRDDAADAAYDGGDE